MRSRQYLYILIVFVFAAALAHAQLPSAPEPQYVLKTGSINGTVTDVDDDAVPHTTITLDGQGPVDHQSVVADGNGFFKLTGLHAGTYRLSVNAKGFADWTSPDITLAPGQNLDLKDITLQLATEMTTVTARSYTLHEMAVQQVKIEETQKLVGVIPNFYIVYGHNFAPLSAGQKFSLAWKSILDPTTFAFAGISAGIQQGVDTPSEWGKDWPGYGQRYGASFALGATSLMITGDILPTLLHQDPRYFYKGTGSIRSRVFYAIATSTVVCKGDNGHWQPNYSNVLGNFASAGLSNVYYPTNNGIGLTVSNALIDTASGAVSGILEEFLLRHFTSHAKSQ